MTLAFVALLSRWSSKLQPIRELTYGLLTGDWMWMYTQQWRQRHWIKHRFIHRAHKHTYTARWSPCWRLCVSIWVVSTEKCLTSYMPIMPGMSVSSPPGSITTMGTCLCVSTLHFCFAVNLSVICLLVFDLFCYTYCMSLWVSISATCLKCLLSWWSQPFCLLLFCWKAYQCVGLPAAPSVHVSACLSLFLDVLWLQVSLPVCSLKSEPADLCPCRLVKLSIWSLAMITSLELRAEKILQGKTAVMIMIRSLQ